MIYISKTLKPWVYESKSDLKVAYDECWRQKEQVKDENKKLREVLNKIRKISKDSINSDCEENHWELMDIKDISIKALDEIK